MRAVAPAAALRSVRAMRSFCIALLTLPLLFATSCGDSAKPAEGGAAAQPAAAQTTGSMDAAIQTLMAKPEHADESITVQHVLIAFQGAPRIQGVTRSKDEAKVLAEQVWKESLSGADFKALMKQHSNDGGPGEYPMTKAGRMQMVKGFGDVGFRLAVGEIGVAPWDQTASPFGWHIIKRVK
jgi:parvulin-like peptidyl-prolyl isomerase